MSWWLFAPKSKALSSSEDFRRIKNPFEAGASGQLPKNVSTIWANCWNAGTQFSERSRTTSPLNFFWISGILCSLALQSFSLRKLLRRLKRNPVEFCMMKPSWRLCHGTNWPRNPPSNCNFYSFLGNLGLLSVRVPVLLAVIWEGFVIHPFQNSFLFWQTWEGKEILKVSCLSLSCKVEGVLGQLWASWNSYGVEDWTVEVHHSWYLIPFHHLSPVVQQPLKFPSCGLRSVKAWALWDKVDKMLEKGTLKLVD